METERQLSNSRRYCSVYGCKSYKTGTKSLHYFPVQKVQRERWASALSIGKPVTRYMTVCSLHFREDDFFPQRFLPIDNCRIVRKLKKNAVPSLNLPEKRLCAAYEQQKFKRKEKSKRRTQKKEGGNELAVEVKTEVHSDDVNSEEGCPSPPLIKEECMEEPTCRTVPDVKIALLRLRQKKLLLELEKLSEERERIAAEKKNVTLHLEILKLRLQLMGCPTSAETRISCGRNIVGTEGFQGFVNVSVSRPFIPQTRDTSIGKPKSSRSSVSRPSIPQTHDTSVGKPKSSRSSVGTQVSSTQLAASNTAGSFPLDNSLNRLSNINSAPIPTQSLSTSNYPVSFQPINRPGLPDNLGNLCLLPVAIPCSASNFPAALLNIGDLSPIFQTGINNVKASGESGSSQIGLVLQDRNFQQQNLLSAKPTSPSTPATSNNPPQAASNKTVLNQNVNSSQLNSSCQPDGSRKELESTDNFIVPHSVGNLLERDECIVISTSNSTAGNVPRVKEKVDAGGNFLERDVCIVISASNSTPGNVPRMKEKVDTGGNLLERDECIVISTSNSTAGNVPRVKEKVDAGGPSKKLRLSTEDSR